MEKRPGNGKTKGYVPNSRDNEALTLLEAKAYMQSIVKLLRENGRVPESEERTVGRIMREARSS